MSNVILEIKNLSKYYGKTLGVKDLSLTLNSGEIFGFIGPNGAGKSTTIRSVMNLISKTEGNVYINGKEFTKDDIETKKIIGYLPSEINLYEDLTVREILNYHESFYNFDIHDNRCKLVKRLNLDETKKIEDLSLGNLKKLGIVLAFMHNPKIWILDEATSGLDPVMQQEFYKMLQEEKEKGTTIFYSTHILSEVAKICDRVGIIKSGNLLKIESIEELKNKNLTNIFIESDDIEKIVNDLNLDKNLINGKTIKFKNELDIDTLIKKFSNYKISRLLIEEGTLEDIFFTYYK